MIIDELRARCQLLIAARQRLAGVVAQEHRDYADAELLELSKLNGAISAIIYTINELPGPQSANPAPAAGSDYRLVASEAYQATREHYRVSAQLMADYGRWLIATIAAIHFGGIYLIATAPDVELAEKEPAIWALVAGIVLIVASGLAAWSNWGTHAQLSAKWANAWMLIDPDAWPKEDPSLASRIYWTHLAALTFGILSILCMPLAMALLSIYAV